MEVNVLQNPTARISLTNEKKMPPPHCSPALESQPTQDKKRESEADTWEGRNRQSVFTDVTIACAENRNHLKTRARRLERPSLPCMPERQAGNQG